MLSRSELENHSGYAIAADRANDPTYRSTESSESSEISARESIPDKREFADVDGENRAL